MNKRQKSVAMLLGMIAPLLVATEVRAEKEVEITLDDAPAAVRETILREAAGAKITEVERVTAKGRTFYEAEFMRNGREVEIQVAEDGTLMGSEVEEEDEEMTLDQVPPAVKRALLKLAGGAPIDEVERETEYGAELYEAEWTEKGVTHEAAVTADGEIVEVEQVIAADAAPQAVRDVIAKQFGAGAKVVVEKKMFYIYEIESEVDGREKEIMVMPTGQILHHPHDGDDDDNDENDD